MPNVAEINEISQYLIRITEATRAGSMKWSKANPTTYIWNADGPPPAKLILQRVSRDTYVLRALEAGNSTEKLVVEDFGEPVLDQHLTTLWEQVQSSVTRRGLDFLKSILPPA